MWLSPQNFGCRIGCRIVDVMQGEGFWAPNARPIRGKCTANTRQMRWRSVGALSALCQHAVKSLSVPYPYSIGTLLALFQHPISTLSVLCQHSISTLSAPYQYSVSTLPALCRHCHRSLSNVCPTFLAVFSRHQRITRAQELSSFTNC